MENSLCQQQHNTLQNKTKQKKKKSIKNLHNYEEKWECGKTRGKKKNKKQEKSNKFSAPNTHK